MTGINNRDRMVKTAEIGGCNEVHAPTGWLNADRPDALPNGQYAVLIPMFTGKATKKMARQWIC